jgi:hypothetical protein
VCVCRCRYVCVYQQSQSSIGRHQRVAQPCERAKCQTPDRLGRWAVSAATLHLGRLSAAVQQQQEKEKRTLLLLLMAVMAGAF